MNEADRKVNELILTIFKRDKTVGQSNDAWKHLHECDSTFVYSSDARDGIPYCDTYCEGVEIDALLVCDHDRVGLRYCYGEFGSIDGLLYQLEQMDEREPWAF